MLCRGHRSEYRVQRAAATSMSHTRGVTVVGQLVNASSFGLTWTRRTLRRKRWMLCIEISRLTHPSCIVGKDCWSISSAAHRGEGMVAIMGIVLRRGADPLRPSFSHWLVLTTAIHVCACIYLTSVEAPVIQSTEDVNSSELQTWG